MQPNSMQPKFVKIVMAYPGASTDQILPSENYIERPLHIMAAKGFDTEIITSWKKGLSKDDAVHGYKVKRFSNYLSMFWYLFTSRDIKIVHSFLRPYPPSLLAGLLFNKKKLITPSTYILGSNKLVTMISKFLMKRFNRVIAQTPYEYDLYLKECFDPKKIVLLPCAVDHGFFSAKIPLDKKALAAKYHFDAADFIICTVANVRKFKNIDIILEAFGLFHSKYPGSHFILAGKDMLQSEMFLEQKKQQGPASIQQVISNLQLEDAVTVTGSLATDEVREVHHSADLFVNSSDPEAQGIAAYEAAASGLPLCLSAIEAFSTVFKDFVLYHNPRDAEALAGNFERYFAEPQLRHEHSKALQELMQEWDVPLIEQKLSKLYGEVLTE